MEQCSRDSVQQLPAVDLFGTQLDAMIDKLEKYFAETESPDHCEVIDSLVSCIAVSDPDGTGIIRAPRRLPANIESDA